MTSEWQPPSVEFGIPTSRKYLVLGGSGGAYSSQSMFSQSTNGLFANPLIHLLISLKIILKSQKSFFFSWNSFTPNTCSPTAADGGRAHYCLTKLPPSVN